MESASSSSAPAPEPGHHAFISHASEDREAATSICEALEASGTPCWIAPRDIPAGAVWADEILKSIAHARALVLVLTRGANASRQVLREVRCADDRGVPVVPVRVDEVPLSGTLEFYLGDSQWIDALARPLQNLLPDLVARIRSRILVERDDAQPAAEAWRPPKERILRDLSGDLKCYRDLAFRMQAAMSDSSRVVAHREEANRIFIDAIVAYNDFGRAFMERLPEYRTAIRKYWGPRHLTAYQELHTFLESEIYRGRMFALNDVRARLNDLSFGPVQSNDVYADVDRCNAPPLGAARAALEELSVRVDAFLGSLEESC
jgi:hypothetical protein